MCTGVITRRAKRQKWETDFFFFSFLSQNKKRAKEGMKIEDENKRKHQHTWTNSNNTCVCVSVNADVLKRYSRENKKGGKKTVSLHTHTNTHLPLLFFRASIIQPRRISIDWPPHQVERATLHVTLPLDDYFFLLYSPPLFSFFCFFTTDNVSITSITSSS